jgi:HAD superfamily hydrolase (TIGR01509 family)
MKDYDAYLFDWDGTLGKTLELWLEVYRELLERFGIHGLSDELIASGFGRLRDFALEVGVRPEDVDALVGGMKEAAARRSITVDLYDSVPELLERLKNKGKKLALITTNWVEAVNIMLEKHGLEHTFEVIVTGEDVREHKPDPEGIHITLEKLGVTKDKAVMLGDSDKDLGAAKNAGIDSILFYPPSHELFYKLSELSTHEPVRIITGWHQFFED